MFGLSQAAERIVWVLALVLVSALVIFGYSWHERRVGAAGCIQSVQKTNAAAEVKEEKQHAVDTGTVQREGTTYAAQIAAPVIRAPIIRLCPEIPRSPVPAAAGAGPEDHAQAPGGEGDQGRPTTWDSTPVVRAGRDADAQIAGLQDYILNVCRPK